MNGTKMENSKNLMHEFTDFENQESDELKSFTCQRGFFLFEWSWSPNSHIHDSIFHFRRRGISSINFICFTAFEFSVNDSNAHPKSFSIGRGFFRRPGTSGYYYGIFNIRNLN